MNVLKNGRHLPRLLALLSILALLIWPNARVGASAVTQIQPALLDLPAIALTPAALEQIGLAGFADAAVDVDSSGWRSLGDEVADSVAANVWLGTVSIEHLNVELARTGWQRQYQRLLAQPDPADLEYVSTSIKSVLTEFADPEGADNALTLLMNGGNTVSPGTRPSGERLELRTDIDPNSGVRLVVAFRESNLIGSVEIVQYGSTDDPDIEPALLLARQLQIRLDAELTTHDFGLADAAVHLSTLAGPAELEGYTRLDGETVIAFGESAEDFAERDAAYADAIDVYQLEQSIAPASDEVAPPYYINRLYRFSDESAAQVFLDSRPQELADDVANSGGDFDAQVVENATSFGDNSLIFEIQDQLDAGTTHGYRVYVQVGSIVARLQLDSSNDISIDAAEAVATAQADCLEAGSCVAAEQPPVSLPGIDCPPTHEGEGAQSLSSPEFAPVPMFGADPARSGAQPGPGPSGNMSTAWQVDVRGQTSNGPVISDNLVVFSSAETTEWGESNNLYAFDPTTHEFLWCIPTGDAIADPSIDSGTVFTEANAIAGKHFQTSVVALDAATGIEQWQFPIGPAVAPYDAAVTAADGAIYVTTGMGAVFALDEASGTPLWFHQVDQDADMSQLTLSYPAIARGVVYVSGGRVLYALNAESGEELWSIEADDEDEVFGMPSVANGLVYAGGKHAVYAVDASTGDEQWVAGVEGSDAAALAVADGIVYATGGHDIDVTSNGYIAAFAADTGNQIWRLDLEGFLTAPVAVGDVVYFDSGNGVDETTVSGNLVALSAADGTVLVNYPLDGKVTTPVIAGAYVYIGESVVSEEGQQGTLNVIGGDSAPTDEIPIMDRKSG